MRTRRCSAWTHALTKIIDWIVRRSSEYTKMRVNLKWLDGFGDKVSDILNLDLVKVVASQSLFIYIYIHIYK